MCYEYDKSLVGCASYYCRVDRLCHSFVIYTIVRENGLVIVPQSLGLEVSTVKLVLIM